MKTLKKLTFFILTYNIIFILFLKLQYIYRFDREIDFSSSLMYSSIFSITFSVIPIVCFSFSWFISNEILTRKLKVSSILNSTTILLITAISTYICMEIMFHNSFLSLLTVSSTTLTLLLFFYSERKHGSNHVRMEKMA